MQASPYKLALSAAVYAATAAADIVLTLRGLGGNSQLEGNPIVRAMMDTFGVETGLFTGKILVGVVCLVIAVVCEPAVRRKDPWIFRFTVFEATQAWLRRGDRSWIAYVPIVGVAAMQALAALSWVWVLRT